MLVPLLLNRRAPAWTVIPPPGGCGTLWATQASGFRACTHTLRPTFVTTRLDAGVSLR